MAWKPYASRKLAVMENWNNLDIAYGETGWNGVSSVCGAGTSFPKSSEVTASSAVSTSFHCLA